MDKSRRRGTTAGKEGAVTGKEFWKQFFVSLSLSLLATAVIVSVMSAGKTARSGTKNKLI